MLKLVHDRGIDTAVRFVHPNSGYKHALRYLAVNYLNRSIQSKNGGHNSVEDARAALDLAVLFAEGGEAFRRSFEETRPYASRRNCLLGQIAQADPRARIVCLGWNDYVMSVSQSSRVGDMMMMNSYQSAVRKLETIGRSPRPAKFVYVYGVEYHFAEINAANEEKEKSANQLSLEKLLSAFDENYPNSLLCVLLMKKSFSDSPVAGQFIVHMHSDHQ